MSAATTKTPAKRAADYRAQTGASKLTPAQQKRWRQKFCVDRSRSRRPSERERSSAFESDFARSILRALQGKRAYVTGTVAKSEVHSRRDANRVARKRSRWNRSAR